MTCPRCGQYGDGCNCYAATQRRWNDLTEDEQARVKRLLTPDPDDNLDDLLARMRRASQIIRGEKP